VDALEAPRPAPPRGIKIIEFGANGDIVRRRSA